VPAMHKERRRGQRPGHHDQLPVTRTTASSAECSSPAAAASRGRRKWSGHRPDHNDHVRATEATSNEKCGAAGNGLGTTIKYLRRKRNGAAGSGLGTTTKFL
jgi:hypothetical protein